MKVKGSCTTVLVGKAASIDGSTIIARNDDGHEALDPQQFVLVKPEDQPKHYQAVISGVEIDLPDNPLAYTSIPNAVKTNGIWAAAGINSENVAMSATETITTNPRVLGIDPYEEKGIGEEDIVVLVLPYIHSAREGVERLGALLEEFGTYEPNAIAFADKDEVWWLETIGGHHWAAVKIPDTAYVVAANRRSIDEFDFHSDDTLCSKDLKDLIEKYHLNPNPGHYNLRHIFGSATVKDTVYNNPRVWYSQKFFNPEITSDPQDQDLPFICHADRKISPEDVKWALSSHFENTKYDPYGSGTEAERTLFRPVGINRNHNSHMLQIRNGVPAEIAGIHWLAFGANPFNVMVPFYSHVQDTPASYRDASAIFDMNNMYWLSSTIALLGDSDYDLYVDFFNTYQLETAGIFRNIQKEADEEIENQADKTRYLEEINQRLADESVARATAILGEMVKFGSNHMTLRYDLND